MIRKQKTVLVQRHSVRVTQARIRVFREEIEQCYDFFYEGQAGASFPGLFASMARAYLNEFDATEEDFAHVAVKNHENGILNPKAHLLQRARSACTRQCRMWMAHKHFQSSRKQKCQ